MRAMASQHDHSPGNLGGAVVLLIIAGGAAAGATQTDQTGPILAFIGALLVVVITAVTANRRQAHQLAAEAERHRESLQSESDRLKQRLDHEQQLTDVEHLRELFDAAMAAFETAHVAATNLTLALQAQGNAESRRTAWTTFTDGLTNVAVELHRLELRLPPEHSVVTSYDLVRLRLFERADQLVPIETSQVITGAEVQEATRLITSNLDALKDFARAAREKIGVSDELAKHLPDDTARLLCG